MAMLEPTSSLICAYILDGKGSGRAVSAAELESWSPEQGVLWVHLDVQQADAGRWLKERGDIDELMREALLAAESRPRAVPIESRLLLVLRGMNTNPGQDPDDMVSIRLWLDGKRIISAQRRNLMSVQDIRDAIGNGQGPRTSGEFVVHLVERLMMRIGDAVDKIEDAMESAEDKLFDEDSGALRAALGPLRRQTAAIRRYLAPQREALDRLHRQPGPFFSDDDVDELREQADRVTRYLEDLDLARETAIVLQEELLGQLAHEQNSRIYVLSLVAAIFLPLTFVTGLLGMNVAGLPGRQNPEAFLWTIVLMAGLAAALAAFFKWRKWI